MTRNATETAEGVPEWHVEDHGRIEAAGRGPSGPRPLPPRSGAGGSSGRTAGVVCALLIAVLPPVRAEEPASPDLARLVRDLGHREWARRQDAQERLLATGSRAVELLRKAAAAGDPELARRAEWLLSKLDPRIGVFTIVRLELGDTTRVVRLAHWRGPPGENVTIDCEVAESTPPPTYGISWTSLGPDRLDVQISEGRQRGQLARLLAPPLDLTPSVSVVRTSEECGYERLGWLRRTERRRFITLVWHRQERTSDATDLDENADPHKALRAVEDAILRQAISDDQDLRVEAFEILSLVRVAGASSTLAEGLQDPEVRELAAIGLGLSGDTSAIPPLLELVQGIPDERRGPPPGRGALVSRAIRGAVALVSLGREEGLQALVEALAHSDAPQMHALMAELSDHVAMLRSRPSTRQALFESVMRPEILRLWPWNDPEKELLLTRLLQELRPGAPVDAGMARSAMARFESAARDNASVAAGELDVLSRLWRIARSRHDGANDAPDRAPREEFFVRLFEPPPTRSAVYAAELLLKEHHGIAPGDALVRAMAGSLSAAREDADAELRRQAQAAMLRLAKSLEPESRAATHVVEVLLEITEEETDRSRLSQIQRELARLTGIASAAAGPESLGRYREWLEHARRDAPTANGETVVPNESAVRHVAYIFELRVPRLVPSARQTPPRGTATRRLEEKGSGSRTQNVSGTSSASPSRQGSTGLGAEVVDGHRVVLAAGEVRSFRDRWGGTRRLRLELTENPRAGRRYALSGSATGAILIAPGYPQVLNAPRGPLEARWYRTSPLTNEVTFLPPPPGAPVFRAVVLAAREEDTLPWPAQDGEGRGDPVSLLWDAFVDRYLVNLPDDATAAELNAFRQRVRVLALREAIPTLERLLEKKSDPLTAQLLAELGEDAGFEHLRHATGHGEPRDRLEAAWTLADVDPRSGTEALLELAETFPELTSRYAYVVCSRLGRCIDTAPRRDPLRIAAIDFVFEHLDEPAFRNGALLVVRKLAGTDFRLSGGTPGRRTRLESLRPSARGRDATGAAAGVTPLEEARAWWKAHRARLISSHTPPRRQ